MLFFKGETPEATSREGEMIALISEPLLKAQRVQRNLGNQDFHVRPHRCAHSTYRLPFFPKQDSEP